MTTMIMFCLARNAENCISMRCANWEELVEGYVFCTKVLRYQIAKYTNLEINDVRFVVFSCILKISDVHVVK